MRIRTWSSGLAVVALAVAAALRSSARPRRHAHRGASAKPKPSAPAALGAGRRRAEARRVGRATSSAGSGGEQLKDAPDWVTPFETATGCKVTVKVGLGTPRWSS